MKEIKTTASGAQQMNPSATAAEGEKKNINAELWQACAGPLVNLAAAGTHVVYFPQGHSEQVAASMRKDIDAQIPNYPNLPSKLLCLLHSVTLHADPETDEVYAQMTLQPVHAFDNDALLRSDLSMKINKPQTDFFCKTLTASDTSTHGGFSVPRRAAEKIFPPLDFTMQPPAQEIVARDLHDNIWSFRHIYRGQPKRHLLTTGWSLFVSGKRLLAGDSVLFIRDEKQHLLLGIRRAHRQPTNLPSSVLSSDSMHIGILAAAAHAAANNSPFTVFYNPRTSPSEFVIPLAKYYKAACSNQISLGMRFRMMFETEESGTRRFMGTITGISDLDPVRWKNSQWRNLQIGWDESTTGDRRSRVSIWEIEPVTAPFFICPTPPFFSAKRPRLPGMPDDDTCDLDNLFRKRTPWLGDEFGLKVSQPGLSLAQWMNMQQNPSVANSIQTNYLNQMPGASAVQNLAGLDVTRKPTAQVPPGNQIPLQYNGMKPVQPIQHLEQPPKMMAYTLNTLGSITTEQQQLADIAQLPTQNFNFPTQFKSQFLQPQIPSPGQNALQKQQSLANNIQQSNLSQKIPTQMPILSQTQPHNIISSQSPDHGTQQSQVAENQMQIQLLQKLHMQQQSMLSHQTIQDQQKLLADIQQTFARSVPPDQVMDSSQGTSRSVQPQPQPQPQQMTRNDSQMNLWFSQQSQQSKLQQTWNATSNQLSAGGSNSLLTGTVGGGQSVVTDDVPSCSTSPSTNNSHNAAAVRAITNERIRSNQVTGDEIAQSSTSLLNSCGLETISSIGNLGTDLQKKADAKPRFNMSSRGPFASHLYANDTGAHVEYLDGMSSATSSLSHNEVQLPPSSNSLPFNCESMLFRDASHDGEQHLGDPRSSMPIVSNIDSELGVPEPLTSNNVVVSSKDFSSNLFSAGGLLSGYDNSMEAQPELSSSVVSQSFGVPDMAFNSVDANATMNDGSLMNKGSWAPLQIPRMRTYTKVYKRGAVGRSIDITRYSGYDELKQDLARRFGIEGQLENRQRVGWKLVYVDHENDVLLVGDDPWEEFVSCVRCIKILSPQEVQQMSLDGDLGNSSLQNQACSSSDNGMS